ncbi:uncharacterized protein EDB91DRAFT_1099212 [Suillus paluster]|uniref:uncharacterized protein n=1 Tax=Suillus paluster TaxID=48578 RepID=UPI001B863807|nr:uncharacterized protein EDB91DRAFT_1099212 [Suillus paluster]KAG1753666.1 hypothetical protein EDB91DRAFT_1099212 [Suillus paluster]
MHIYIMTFWVGFIAVVRLIVVPPIFINNTGKALHVKYFRSSEVTLGAGGLRALQGIWRIGSRSYVSCARN